MLKFATLFLTSVIAFAATASAHTTEAPHPHPHLVGDETGTIALAVLLIAAGVGMIAFARHILSRGRT